MWEITMNSWRKRLEHIRKFAPWIRSWRQHGKGELGPQGKEGVWLAATRIKGVGDLVFLGAGTEAVEGRRKESWGGDTEMDVELRGEEIDTGSK